MAPVGAGDVRAGIWLGVGLCGVGAGGGGDSGVAEAG